MYILSFIRNNLDLPRKLIKIIIALDGAHEVRRLNNIGLRIFHLLRAPRNLNPALQITASIVKLKVRKTLFFPSSHGNYL